MLYLPIHDIAVNEGRVGTGPMANYPMFVLVFAVAVAVSTRLRGYRRLLPMVASSAVILGVVQGVRWGTGDAVTAGTSVVLWLLLALRVFTLALRDWRDPIGTSFGVGAGVLLAEVILLGGFAEARQVFPLAVPQFFLASLASRAASVRLSTRRVRASRADAHSGTASTRGARAGMGVLAIAVFALVMGMAILLGGRHGGLLLLGRLILSAVIPLLAYVLAPVAGFILVALVWLFGLLHIDLSPLRSIAQTIGDFRADPPPATGTGGGPVGRVLALLLLLSLGFLLVRTIRMRWQRFERKGGGLEEEIPELVPVSIFSPRRRRKRSRPAQELPADTVRRWYAEALLALDRLGLPKGASRTPGEYLQEVTFAFPECAPGFTALTRAYEDVRYGSRRFDQETLWKVEANQQHAMTALGRAQRLEPPSEETP